MPLLNKNAQATDQPSFAGAYTASYQQECSYKIIDMQHAQIGYVLPPNIGFATKIHALESYHKSSTSIIPWDSIRTNTKAYTTIISNGQRTYG